MTSLLGRMLRLFPESVPLEDLFTEAIARLFETYPDLCITWLVEAGLIPLLSTNDVDREYVRISSQKPFTSLEHHDIASRPDLLIETHRPQGGDAAEDETISDVVMVESKIGSKEGQEQLRRYAEHLDEMPGFASKMLVYITHAYDPKDPKEIVAGLGGVGFKQLRWHDFYRFLQEAESDVLVEEVMAFMEEQRMATSYRFSVADLIALSNMPRAFEIFDETLQGEVKAELESFTGNKTRAESTSVYGIRHFDRYTLAGSLHEWDFHCLVGYAMRTSDGYPAAIVQLRAKGQWEGKDAWLAVMKKIGLREGWEGFNLNNPEGSAGVQRMVSLASLLQEEDHVAAVKRFFVESIRELREELTAFKEDHPELPWEGS